MPRRSYTLMVLSSQATRARQFRVTQLWLRIARVGGILVLIAVSYMLYHFVTIKTEVRQLRRIVQEQEVLVGKVQTMHQEMGRMRTLDNQIRRLAGLETASATESTMAMGGGTLEIEQVLTAEEQAARQQLIAQLFEDVEHLEREVALQAESFEALTAYLTEQKDRLAATPSIWPAKGYVSSKFGPRISPFTGRRQRHTGIDIAAARGTPVLAPADGVVTYSGKLVGYGRAIVIDHGFGIKTFYGHNHQNKVKKGQRVARGQVIAAVGSSGYSTGSHLHYEVLVKDTPVNPLKYIVDENRRAAVLRKK
ncbi:MAG: M23 family metallopeptidase [Candidatus Methylomirabilales bacterium]